MTAELENKSLKYVGWDYLITISGFAFLPVIAPTNIIDRTDIIAARCVCRFNSWSGVFSLKVGISLASP
jgi:hypothetical protein